MNFFLSLLSLILLIVCILILFSFCVYKFYLYTIPYIKNILSFIQHLNIKLDFRKSLSYLGTLINSVYRLYKSKNILVQIKEIFWKMQKIFRIAINQLREAIKSISKLLSNCMKTIRRLILDMYHWPFGIGIKRITKALIISIIVLYMFASQKGTILNNIIMSIEQNQPLIYLVYILLVLVAGVYMLFDPILSAKRENDKVVKPVRYLLSIIMAWVLIYSNYITLLGQAQKGEASFVVVFVSIIFAISLTFYTILEILDYYKNNLFIMLVGIVSAFMVSGFILVAFGIYNVTTDNLYTIIEQSSYIIFKLMYSGAENAYDFPIIKPAESIVPFIQFITWNLYNLTIFGFFIAYFYELITLQRTNKTSNIANNCMLTGTNSIE